MIVFLLTHEHYGCGGEGASTEVLSAFLYEERARDAAVAWAKQNSARFGDAVQLFAVSESGAARVDAFTRQRGDDDGCIEWLWSWDDAETALVTKEPLPEPSPGDTLFAAALAPMMAEMLATPPLSLMKLDGFATFSVEDKRKDKP